MAVHHCPNSTMFVQFYSSLISFGSAVRTSAVVHFRRLADATWTRSPPSWAACTACVSASSCCAQLLAVARNKRALHAQLPPLPQQWAHYFPTFGGHQPPPVRPHLVLGGADPPSALFSDFGKPAFFPVHFFPKRQGLPKTKGAPACPPQRTSRCAMRAPGSGMCRSFDPQLVAGPHMGMGGSLLEIPVGDQQGPPSPPHGCRSVDNQ